MAEHDAGMSASPEPDGKRTLYQTELHFRLLVQAVRDYAIYMLDPDGYVVNWNVGAQVIKGYSEDEIVGQHFSRFYTPEDRAAGEPARALQQALKAGKYEREGWRVRKSGERFWANVLIDPVYDEAGKHIGFAKVTRDVTERKQAEDQLEETRAALAQSQKLLALGELAGGIAHDFNNLMTVVRGSAELLRRPDLPEDRRLRYLDAITATADRAARLTGHLLAFSRRQPLKPEVLDLARQLTAFAEMMSRMLGSTIQVRLDVHPELWRVEADPAQLETALLNVAINARDAMPQGGILTIAATNLESEDLVCVALTDTGGGMSAEVMERAFEPFFTTKPVGKGTGLGLSQIHGFAAQTGGRAEIDSVLGQGTTIRLLLPRTQGTPVNGERVPTELPEGLKILLVEDHDDVGEFARHLLEDLHCQVASATSGEQALSMLEGASFDAVITDVIMPGMSGVELARRIRERMPGLPVLLASGYSADILSAEPGEFHLLAKPYGREELAQALARIRLPGAPVAA
ncbi:MAG: PAS domain S-box protein [Proteobacteria bacterium]|nr:PAS domain S-box protein [Pseudomonadota bacterium]